MSLNNQSAMLSNLGRREEALEAITKAVDLILPLLERQPYVMADAGLRLAQSYLQRNADAGSEPDEAVVSRLVTVLQRAGVIDPPESDSQ